MAAPLGPVKPIKKPKPKKISFVNNEFGWLDAEQDFELGSTLYVCTQDDPALYDIVESGTYTTATGLEVTIIDGIIDEISS